MFFKKSKPDRCSSIDTLENILKCRTWVAFGETGSKKKSVDIKGISRMDNTCSIYIVLWRKLKQ